MRAERFAWLGNVIMAGLAIVLAVVPLIPTLSKWAIVAVAVLLILAAVLLFPYRTSADAEAPARLVNVVRVRGNRNQVQSGGNSAQLNQAGRDITVDRSGNS